MKFFIFAAIAFTSATSHADVIKCFFTDPQVETVFNSSKSTLTVEGKDIKKTVIAAVSLQIKDAGIFEVVSKDGEVIQTLKLDGNGDDGNLDKTYPYSVQYGEQFGGCTSNHLKVKNELKKDDSSK